MKKNKFKFHFKFRWLVFSLIAITHFWVASNFSFEIFGKNILSEIYDSLAKSLIHFHTDVDPQSVGYEAFIINGRTHTYFGIFPAFFRILTNLFMPSLFGHWARVSCLLADLTIALAMAGSLKTVLAFEKNAFEEIKREIFVWLMATFLMTYPLWGTPPSEI